MWQVARLAGIPDSVVAKAEEAGAQLEQRLEVCHVLDKTVSFICT
jgi:DNA mismatch repair ATPase MutS